MPEVRISIGGRPYDVACQEGEEKFLHTAAALLETEARVLASQASRIPEARMLLMAGLMLADKTAGLEDQVRMLEARLAEREAEAEELRSRPAPKPERIEVPVIPMAVTDTLAELAARAEALAAAAEERLGPA
jgi:cell division protein ZapA